MVLLKFNEKKKEWEVLTKQEKNQLSDEEKEKVIYLDGHLKEKLDFAKAHRAKNNDCIGIIDGPEGSGKSTLGGNVMMYMTDGKFDPITQMVGSDYEDALDKIENVPKGGNLMFDEGNAFFLSTETMTREHRDLHKIFSIFRQKNLFVLIVMPSFFRLGTYFAVDRAKFLLHTYTDKGGDRGFFLYFGTKAKNKLYRKGKKEHNHGASAPSFRPGRFTTCPTLENPEYVKFKMKTLKEAFQRAKPKKKKTKSELLREFREEQIRKNPDEKGCVLAKNLGVSTAWVSITRKKLENT